MKKLLLLLFFLPFLAQSQIVVPRGTKSVAVEDAYLYTTFGFKIPRYADTTAANLMMGHDSVGLQIQTTTVDGIWHRAQSTGAFHKWVLTGTGSGGGGVDTIFVTQIGVGSPQIPLLYAVDGNLRTARLVPGVFTTPAMNLDSGVHVDLDTTGLGGAAYKAWIIAQYGPGVGGNIYTIDGKIQTDRHLSGSYTHSLFFDSLAGFDMSINGGVSTIHSFDNNTNLQVEGTRVYTNVFGSFTNYWEVNGDSLLLRSTDGGSNTTLFSLTPTKARLKGLVQANDTTARKPVAIGTDGSLVVMDGWAGSGGGGGSGFSVTTAANTANYTVPSGRKIFVILSDLTGQANRNAVLPGSPTTGDEAVFRNINTSASTFNWTFTVGTVKDYGNNSITTLTNQTVYHLVYDGAQWDIIN